jgi:hypothetical protein
LRFQHCAFRQRRALFFQLTDYHTQALIELQTGDHIVIDHRHHRIDRRDLLLRFNHMLFNSQNRRRHQRKDAEQNRKFNF